MVWYSNLFKNFPQFVECFLLPQVSFEIISLTVIFSILTMMRLSVFFKKYLAWDLLMIASGEWCQIRDL